MIRIHKITEPDALRDYEGQWAVMIVHSRGVMVGNNRFFTKRDTEEEIRDLWVSRHLGYSGVQVGGACAEYKNIKFMMPVPVGV